MARCAVFAVALCALGCGKDQGGTETERTPASTACPALSVTVDGAPISGLGHGQGLTVIDSGFTTHMVRLYNHDKTTCADTLALGHASVEPNEVVVGVWQGDFGGVALDSFSHTDALTYSKGTITLEKETDKVGEPIEICVRKPITFVPDAGAYNGKKVTIVGRFTGTFCGINKT